MDNKTLTARFWDNAWGDVEDYAFADDLTQLAGINIGDDVVCTVDEANDPTNPQMVAAYDGEEGVVLGFAAPREGGGPFDLPKTSHNLYVSFDGSDPVIVDPADVEVV